ncbi:General amino acid permease [Malassezia equina]|uniref:General amino acid permease n=1 Tax=Malassezia equina TaxID=1381935 RepID=A0AAF0EES5_9BASI|nr:General amino acid permease [Malassezia equina]
MLASPRSEPETEAAAVAEQSIPLEKQGDDREGSRSELNGTSGSPNKGPRSRQRVDPDSGVRRGLKDRHLNMLALAGIIGPGLLVGAGGALAKGGPASLLLGFGIVGLITFSIMQSLGELTTQFPGGGAFIQLGDRTVDRAFGFIVGWNYFILWVTVLANEYNVITSVLTDWSDKVPQWGYFLIFWFVFLGYQMLGVECFGEAEFWLGLVKLLGLAAYFVFSIVYISGGVNGNAFGFQYWNNPGAFGRHGFRGVAMVFVFCSTFYAGIESVALAATETRNPRKAVPSATRKVFWRILFIYMGSAFFFGVTCPANADGLVNGSSKALQSPMTIAIQHAGWHGGSSLINAFIFVMCLSALNGSVYIGSRTLLFMASDNKAPSVLGYTNRWGVPVWAVILTNACGAISMMNVSTGAAKAYYYIVNVSGMSTFLVWGSVSFMHLRFRAAMRAQQRSIDELPYRALWYPWTAYFGLGASLFLALVQGWSTLSPFDAGDFVDAYIMLPLFPIGFFAYKLFFRTRWVRAREMDLDSGRRFDLDYHDHISQNS